MPLGSQGPAPGLQPASTDPHLLRGSGLQAHPSSLGPRHGWCLTPHTWNQEASLKEASTDAPNPFCGCCWATSVLRGHPRGVGVSGHFLSGQ